MSKKNFSGALARGGLSPAKVEDVATVSPVKVRADASDLDERIDKATAVMNAGGLLASRYTSEAAVAAGLPRRKFKVSELKVHPYNVRPVSGRTNLDDLVVQMKEHGQQDPIHVVPHKGGWAIMEGQRRWLAAPLIDLEELDAWVHPEPPDLFEVYEYGRMIHSSREDTTAIDDAIVWWRMIEDGVVADQAALAIRAKLDQSTVSRTLAVLKAGPRVLDEIRKAPARFGDRHLYAIAQIHDRGGEEAALDAARRVITAPDDKPLGARKLEALAAELSDQDGPKKGRRLHSVPLVIRNTEETAIGTIKAYRDGRLEFRPTSPMPEADAEKMAQEVKALISRYLLSAH